jgi:hypothetical protein
MDEVTKIDQMRRYWLGLLSEETRLRCEDLWFESDEDAELLAAVRDDLIEEYLSDELSPAEKNSFSDHAIGQLGLERELSIARAIRDANFAARTSSEFVQPAPTKGSWIESITASFRGLLTPSLRPLAFGMPIILLVAAAFIGFRVLVPGPESAHLDVRVDQPANPDDIGSEPKVGSPPIEPSTPQETAKIPKNDKVQSPGRKPEPSAPLGGTARFDLSDAITMSSGGATKITIPAGVSHIRIKLQRPPIEQGFSTSFAYQLLTPTGGAAASGRILQDLSKLSSTETFEITVPAKLLKAGPAEIVILGRDAANVSKTLTSVKITIQRR